MKSGGGVINFMLPLKKMSEMRIAFILFLFLRTFMIIN